jgi:S-adenosylmethionine synthetase
MEDGSYAPVGGGAFSGKDPSKVDRSGAYLARYIAKHIVEYDERIHTCKVQIGYMIGKAEPCIFNVLPYDKDNNVFGSEEYKNTLSDFCMNLFPTKPNQIIELFGLNKPIYYNITKQGHFGGDAPWEEIDQYIIDQLKDNFK